MKAKRFVTGRRIKVPKRVKTCRDLIRRHIREEGKTIEHDLSKAWQVHPHTAYRILYDKKRSIGPAYIDAFVAHFQLDDFDAHELRLLGAIEAGWQLQPPELV